MKDHKTMLSISTKRAQSLRQLLNWWKKGSLDSVINTLTSKRDTSLVMDFYSFAFAKTALEKGEEEGKLGSANGNLELLTLENSAAVL